MKTYSLANHILSVKPNDPTINSTFGTITIGGEGSHVGSIVINQNNTIFSTTAYATGGWVHSKNLAKNGTITIDLNQLSDEVRKFIMLCETFYSGDYEGFTITLTDNEGNKISTGIDCYIESIPSQSFQNEAQTQTWTFTCGKITFN